MGDNLPDLIGFIGVLVTVIAYLFLQIGSLKIDNLAYSLLNALGSVMILYSLYFHWNLSCVIIETFWLGISLYGSVKILFQKRRHR